MALMTYLALPSLAPSRAYSPNPPVCRKPGELRCSAARRFGGEPIAAPAFNCAERLLRGLLRKIVPGWFVKPSLQVDDVTDIQVSWLKARQIKGLVFDLDDTLIPGFSGVVSTPVKQKIRSLQAEGIRCMVLTNNVTPSYTREAARQLKIPVIGQVRKPRPEAYAAALEKLQLPAKALAMVGDRPLTDILGGNRLGAKTILVKSLNRQNEGLLIRFLRRFERLFVDAD